MNTVLDWFYFLSLLLFCLTAPLMMSLVMILICLAAAWKSLLYFSDSWCTMIFLMIFFGGLLVLFVYISTLAQNETLTPNFNRFVFLAPLIFVMLSFSFSSASFWSTDSPQSLLLFDSNFYFLALFMISYLLVALIVVSHISFYHFGALRQ